MVLAQDDSVTSDAVLAVSNVSKSYGSAKALRNVSFALRAGEFVALLGPNGAGKSTLLQLLSGLFTPDQGRIEVLGYDISKSATRALASIGVVFQQQTLDLELSVQGNLLYHAGLHGLSRRIARERIAIALTRHGLDGRARARTLSGGNRRRVELARATLHNPALLLMDEATVGLDPTSRTELLDEIARLRATENCAVLWATHLIDEVNYADRLIMLDSGEVLYDGTADDLLERESSDDLARTILDMMGRSGPNPDLIASVNAPR